MPCRPLIGTSNKHVSPLCASRGGNASTSYNKPHRNELGSARPAPTLSFLLRLDCLCRRLFLGTSTIHELSVDTSRGEHIAIHLDVTLPRMPCAWLSLDAMDASGEVHIDVHQDMYKQRLGADGREVRGSWLAGRMTDEKPWQTDGVN